MAPSQRLEDIARGMVARYGSKVKAANMANEHAMGARYDMQDARAAGDTTGEDNARVREAHWLAVLAVLGTIQKESDT